MFVFCKGFCEYVGHHQPGGNVYNLSLMFRDEVVSDIVVFPLDMLGASAILRFRCQIDGTLVVAI